MRIRTNKGEEVCDYFIKLEELFILNNYNCININDDKYE